MYFDLNVPIATPLSVQQRASTSNSGKGKGKQRDGGHKVAAQLPIFSPAQVAAVENRLDLLIHLGYTVLALTQTVDQKIDAKTHVNILDPLLVQLKPRSGIVLLKRLTIILDEESEKGFGLTNANIPVLSTYDILALSPTTSATFSLACLSHSQPSQLTCHIISPPLTLPRLPYNLKHTLVGAAIKNGAVFEINYAGVLGEAFAHDSSGSASSSGGQSAKRNWWSCAREIVRATKGKAIVVSGAVANEPNLRAPRDVGNLVSLLGLDQDAAHAASTSMCKSLVLRAQTRKTYRAVLSEPKVVIPELSAPIQPALTAPEVDIANSTPVPPALATKTPIQSADPQHRASISGSAPSQTFRASTPTLGKRPLHSSPTHTSVDAPGAKDGLVDGRKKKKRKKGRGEAISIG